MRFLALILSSMALFAGCASTTTGPSASPAMSAQTECERGGGTWRSVPGTCEQGGGGGY